MAAHPPPVPPEQRPEPERHTPQTRPAHAPRPTRETDPREQGQQANTRQNTTHPGHQQDR